MLAVAGSFERLCSPAIWAEGPVWLAEQQSVIFSDVKGNKMYRWNAQSGVSVFRAESHFANGNALDNEGRLVTCEHGRRGISRTDKQGNHTLLVDKIDGLRFNSPNDIAVRQDGSIWFTDPPYGIVGDEEGYRAASQVIGCYVYRFDDVGNRATIAISDTQRPNGLAFSPDDKWLYVADMSIIDFPTQGRREIRAYRLDGDSAVFSHVVTQVAPGIPDGFCVDRAGNIFCSCETGVLIFSPQGTLLETIPVPERVSNCTFGGPDGNTLFITATTSLYRVTIAPSRIQG
ncbi:Gluconolactonase precursor [Phytobacter ursingii]|uniref:SMP-30/gluconolactonase/LRE family protein n=1 Tax=Phytobacter ursingii TaxID=1972431 RepID=A0AB35RNG2_9ENTR|nr:MULTISPECIES: SMP-30/gluconolactonase/LRE family protein [Enterobacteriaceae]MDV2861587.1 SMP-30/gluconolactonase/LRE family protein [Phytobacter ursingii]GJL33323.1 gluconolactonase [Enterobacter hormaechei]VTP16672.1 Gluconolactonase precursor [Phytobacter ursingii]